MKLQKLNRSLWYSLGLALLLVAGSLTAAAGPALARYRAEIDVKIPFTPNYPERVVLGSWTTVNDNGNMVDLFQEQPNQWKTEGNVTYLEFTAANGTSDSDFRTADQKVRIRLIASLALMADGKPAEVTLRVPKEVSSDTEDPDTAGTTESGGTEITYEEYTATAMQIPKGSALHTTFGDGWVYVFYETKDVTKEDGTTETVQGEERTWTLEGGKFSYYNMKMMVESTNTTDEILLRLQVIGE